jgi:heterodisulfide reductase subunit B
MQNSNIRAFSYFPGCSLATTAKENDLALMEMCRKIGVNLIELRDWNCCGSSSADVVDHEIALDLSARNLFLAPPGRPLLVPCPNCIIRLRQAHLELKQNEIKRYKYEKKWGKPFNTKLQIIHFFELLDGKELSAFNENASTSLQGLRFAPYYGCMLSRPNTLKHEKTYVGLMEKILTSLGAEPLSWPFASRCCGTFLSVAKPDLVTTIVNRIVSGATEAGADCLVTACSMCHLNLEVRCSLKDPIPTMHLSELISLALGVRKHEGWFSRHLVDPRPMLKEKALIR